MGIITGTHFADTLVGSIEPDQIFGFAGNDTIRGGGGADMLFGGGGTDTASYTDSAAGGVFASLMEGRGEGGTAQGDTLNSIENLTGSSFDDTLIGDDGSNVLSGMDQNDLLKGGGGADTLNGGNGNDTLKGGGGADILNGGAGIDTANYSQSSAGVLISLITDAAGLGDAQGDDLNSVENVRGSRFADTLVGDDGVNVLAGLDGNDVIKGFAGADVLDGDEGNDFIDGGLGADFVIGALGDDTFIVDNAGDSISESGGEGIDTVGTSVSWVMTAGADIETLETTQATGTAALNLTGNASGNVVRGNAGNNIINGGDGDDELTGFGGQDSFLFDTPLSAAFNIDVITDFNVADDTIRLDNNIFSSSLGLGSVAGSQFVIGTAALDAGDRIIYDDATGAVYYDSDGVGGVAQIQFATLNTGLALTNFDFFVVG